MKNPLPFRTESNAPPAAPSGGREADRPGLRGEGGPGPVRGDPAWVAPALRREDQTRNVGKTPVFFGPPLAILTNSHKNTMEISGKINRTAERYLEIMKHHGVTLTEPERRCIAHICQIGFMSPLEIRELPDEVRMTGFSCEGLDKTALAGKLDAASFADLAAVVESLGF
jgi:hypothetical protein